MPRKTAGESIQDILTELAGLCERFEALRTEVGGRNCGPSASGWPSSKPRSPTSSACVTTPTGGSSSCS